MTLLCKIKVVLRSIICWLEIYVKDIAFTTAAGVKQKTNKTYWLEIHTDTQRTEYILVAVQTLVIIHFFFLFFFFFFLISLFM